MSFRRFSQKFGDGLIAKLDRREKFEYRVAVECIFLHAVAQAHELALSDDIGTDGGVIGGHVYFLASSNRKASSAARVWV